MFKWLKSLFGFDVPDTPVIAQESAPKAEKKPAAIKAKKTTTKKADKVDLDSMKKDELLAHAKKNGVKANASMNKAALIAAIKNG